MVALVELQRLVICGLGSENMMILDDFVYFLWLLLLALAFVCFLIFQPKIYRYYFSIKKKHGELLNGYEIFGGMNLNDQMAFLLFMIKEKYLEVSDSELCNQGGYIRKLLLINFYIVVLLFCVTFIIFLDLLYFS